MVALEQNVHNLTVMVNAICERQGIIPSMLPGYGRPPSSSVLSSSKGKTL